MKLKCVMLSETLANNNRKGTFSKNNNKSSQVSHAHIDTITSATAQRIVILNLLEQSNNYNKSAKTVTVIMHTPIENDRTTEEFIDIDRVQMLIIHPLLLMQVHVY